VLAADDPRQTDVAHGAKVQIGRWSLTVRADYLITARVLSRERYRFDRLSDLIPEDLVYPASWWMRYAMMARGSRHPWHAMTQDPAPAKYYWWTKSRRCRQVNPI
jgi:hypothetical protein